MLRYNGLKEKMSLDIRPSSALQFSNTGAFVALVNECNVMVFDSIYFESLHVLTGNTSTVSSSLIIFNNFILSFDLENRR